MKHRQPPFATRDSGMTRRRWLQTAGAAVAATPFLNRQALAQKGSPQRLVCWPMMNGAEDRYWLPNAGNFAALSTILEPLKKWANMMTVVKGVNISGSVNHFAVRSSYCGANIANYESADPTVKSVDQILADSIAATAPTAIKAMHLGVIPADSINYYKRAGRSTFFFAPSPVDYEANPVTAFDRFFGMGGGAPGTVTPAPMTTDYTTDSMDLLEAEMNDLGGKLGSSGELAKLAMHRESLKALRPRAIGGAAPPVTPPVSAAGTLASVEKLRPTLQGNAKDAYKHAYFSDVFDAQVDIMARALIAGQTRVATLQAGSADNNLIVPVDRGHPHHNTSHGDQALYSQCCKWYFTKMARFAEALDVPDPLDPGKTVLQNTTILVIAECLPVSHSSNSVPTMLLGGAGGKIKPGFVSGSNITNKQVLATVLKAFNLGPAHFGSSLVNEILA
jgi:hypothetical protein